MDSEGRKVVVCDNGTGVSVHLLLLYRQFVQFFVEPVLSRCFIYSPELLPAMPGKCVSQVFLG